MTTKDRILLSIKITGFFEVDNFITKYNKEYKKDLTSNYPIRLNENNWYEYKEQFIEKRFRGYIKNLTNKEIATKEINYVNILLSKLDSINISFNEKDTFKTLSNRYIRYLNKNIPDTPEQYYNHYLATKRFLLKFIITPYEKHNFQSFLETIDNYKNNYNYILNKLDKDAAFEFKYNTIDHVTKIKEVQRNSIFTIKLEELIISLKEASTPQPINTQTEQKQPETFEELFYNPKNAEICLSILRELQPPVIDAKNNYIGKAKGIFPLWVTVLKTHKPEPLIKHFKDTVYKDLLNKKVNGLNLSKDASEFRKSYKRLENSNIKLDIKAILSQYSQSGKLGK